MLMFKNQQGYLKLKELKKRVNAMFMYATFDELKQAKVTDIYFIRTKKILEEDGLSNVEVNMEVTMSSVPDHYKWVVFGGLKDSLKLLEGLPIDVYSIEEGTIVPQWDSNGIKVPVMFIQGPYGSFVEYETPILGFLATGTGIVTKAARIRKIAGNDIPLITFGARRAHPALAPFYDYYAYIGGFNGVSSILSAEKFLGKKPTGTMPHSLLIIYRFVKGDHAEGWKAYDKYMPPEVPRIMLSDTFSDEVEEVLRAVEAVGKDKIWGVRLDTPGSRKGNFGQIVREVKWKLRQRGYSNVKVFLSGGINEDSIKELIEAGADGFGIGSAIARADPVDFAMDITAIKKDGQWIPISKRGKYDGVKMLWRCIDSEGKIRFIVAPIDSEPPCKDAEPLIKKVIENGKIIRKEKTPDQIREYILNQLSYVDL